MVFIKRCVFLVAPILFTSCYGYYSAVKFVDLTDKKTALTLTEQEACLKSDVDVKMYFEGEPINFEYERIGLIEVNGSSSANDKEVLDELKKEAKKKCCDAVIGIRNSKVEVGQGLLFITDEKDEYKYQSITYSGIAVKIKQKAI